MEKEELHVSPFLGGRIDIQKNVDKVIEQELEKKVKIEEDVQNILNKNSNIQKNADTYIIAQNAFNQTHNQGMIDSMYKETMYDKLTKEIINREQEFVDKVNDMDFDACQTFMVCVYEDCNINIASNKINEILSKSNFSEEISYNVSIIKTQDKNYCITIAKEKINNLIK